MSKNNKAKRLYEEGCNLYLHLFCEKHGFNAEHPNTYWVTNDIGGVAFIGDYAVDMETIRYDIDHDVPKEQWIKWFDYSSECCTLGLTYPNFRSWIKGCPTYSQEQFDEIWRLRKNTQDAQRMLDNYLKNIEPFCKQTLF